MAKLDLTTFDAALQSYYTNDKVQRMSYEDHVFAAHLSKGMKTDFTGKNLPIAIIYGNPAGRSANFAKAQGNKKPGKYTDFFLTRARDFGLVSIDNETIEASSGDAAAFLDAKTAEIDGVFSSLSNSMSAALFRDGKGWIGQVNAAPSNNASTFTLTLKDKGDIVHFDVGQNLKVYSAKTGGSARSSDGTLVTFPVAGIDRDAGTMTITGTYSGSGTMAANDYIFVDGDEDSKLAGLEAWLPSTAPTSGDSFFGVDRSIDPVRLAGVRFDGSAMSIEEALIEAAARLQREGAKPDKVFMNSIKVASLVKELGSKVQRVDTKIGTMGFSGIKLATLKGDVEVYADASCQTNKAWMLTMSTWKLRGLGEMPKFLGGDGLKMLREANDDSVEVRCGYRGNLGCAAPGFNANITLG